MPKRKEGKRKQCPACTKQLKVKDWYYMNGGYYCNKKCYEVALEKAAKAQAKAKASV
jgi:hypothetical protein